MKAVMAHFECLGAIMVADQNIIVFFISIWRLPRQSSRFSIHTAAAPLFSVVTCQPAHQTDWLLFQDDMLYLTNRDLNSPNQDQLIKDLFQHVKSSSTNGRGETISDFAPERHAHWRPRLFCKVRSREHKMDLVLMLKSNNHWFLKIKVLSLVMPWMTRQGERHVSRSQRHLEHARKHFVSPQHRKGNVTIGKRRDTQLSHGGEERKQFLQSILGSLMQFDRRKRIQH